MINRLQTIDKHQLGKCNVTEGNRAFLEESICHLSIDELVYQITDAFFRIFIQ